MIATLPTSFLLYCCAILLAAMLYLILRGQNKLWRQIKINQQFVRTTFLQLSLHGVHQPPPSGAVARWKLGLLDATIDSLIDQIEGGQA